MALKLDERPGSQYDDDWKPPTTNTDDLENMYNAPSATDEDLPAGHPSRAGKTASPGQLAADESAGGAPDASPADRQEQDRLAPSNGGWYKDEGKNGPARGRFWTKRRVAGGGIAGLLIGGILAIASVLQGPAAIIHAGKLLSGMPFAPNVSASESRVGRLFEYYRGHVLGDPTVRNIGYFGEKLTNKYMADLARQGVHLEFERQTDPPKLSRRLQNIRVTNPEVREAMIRQGYTFRADGSLNLGDNQTARNLRVALFATMSEVNEKGRLASFVSKRMLAKRAGVDFSPFRNIARDRGESWIAYRDRVRVERTQAARAGVDPRAGTGDIRGGEEPDPNNPERRRVPPENQQVANDGNRAVNEARNADTPAVRINLARRLAGGGLVAGAVIGVACTARAIGKAIPAYQHANIVLPMIRMGMQFVTKGSQIMAGQNFNLDEVGELYDALYDEETNTSFFGSRGMQAIAGQTTLTGPDATVRPSAVGERPVIFDTLDRIPALNPVCTIQEGVGEFIGKIPVVGGVIEAAEGVVSSIVEAVAGKRPEEFMEELIAVLAGDVVDTFATGAELGNIAAIGSRLAANEKAIASGGTEISPAELQVLRDRYLASRWQHMASLPWTERFLNVYRPNSLANSLLVSLPQLNNTSSVLAFVRTAPDNLLSRAVSLATFGAVAQAQADNTFDFGVPAFGHPQSRLDDESLADPYVVANSVEPRLKELNNKYGRCFGVTINPTTFVIEEEDRPPSYQDLKQNPEFQRCREASPDREKFAIYLLDQRTFKSAACYEGIDNQACEEVGFEMPRGAIAPVGAPTIPAGGYQGQDTSAQPCRIGIDVTESFARPGERGAPTPDPNVKIRLCSVGGIIVNVAIESNIRRLLDGNQRDSAGITKVDGPTGGGYRSHQRQIELRKRNCGTSRYAVWEMSPEACSPVTARPGRSMHEWGLAVDFRCRGASITSRTSPCFKWLENNQDLHGLKHRGGDPWHWSTTGH